MVIAIIAILASLLLPALARAKLQARRVKCVSNLKQLQLGDEMYKNDNKDYLMPNAPANITSNSLIWCPSGSEDWGLSSLNTNIAVYLLCLMAPYQVNQIGVYKCPCDTVAAYNGPRLRSYSMNGQVGIDNSTMTGYNAGYYSYVKGSDIRCPSPSGLFVFLDENPESINDGYLEIFPGSPYGWPDIPAADMGYACGFSYADGHALAHTWQTRVLIDPVKGNTAPLEPVSKIQSSYAVGGAANPDWIWFMQQAVCPDGTSGSAWTPP